MKRQIFTIQQKSGGYKRAAAAQRCETRLRAWLYSSLCPFHSRHQHRRCSLDHAAPSDDIHYQHHACWVPPRDSSSQIAAPYTGKTAPHFPSTQSHHALTILLLLCIKIKRHFFLHLNCLPCAYVHSITHIIHQSQIILQLALTGYSNP